MSASAAPRPSCHAKLRLIQRTGGDAGSLTTVWTDRVTVGLKGRAYHHAKYNETLGVVLLERGGVIVTVLRAAYEHFSFVPMILLSWPVRSPVDGSSSVMSIATTLAR